MVMNERDSQVFANTRISKASCLELRGDIPQLGSCNATSSQVSIAGRIEAEENAAQLMINDQARPLYLADLDELRPKIAEPLLVVVPRNDDRVVATCPG